MDSIKFREDMAKALDQAIRKAKADGVVSMSADNLWQVTAGHIPKTHGPVGTNVQYVVREIFDNMLTLPRYSKFVLR